MRFEIMDGWTVGLETLILFAALALVLLLLLLISARLRRIVRLLEPDSDRTRGADVPATGKAGRYMREDTLAEFMERHKKDGS